MKKFLEPKIEVFMIDTDVLLVSVQGEGNVLSDGQQKGFDELFG